MSERVKFKQDGSTLIITLEGYIEAEASQGLSSKVKDCMEAGTKLFIFDFAEVKILNSVALGELLDILSEGIGNDELVFCFCAVPSKCHFSFKSVGLFMFAEEHKTVEEAIEMHHVS